MTETTTPWSTASEAAADAPASSESNFSMEEHIGSVLLITPTSYKPDGHDTEFKKNRDLLVANIAVIKPKVEDCEEFADVWILQGRLIQKLKGKVGAGMVLGKLITDDQTKGNPAYDLEDASEQATAAATAYYQAKMQPPF